ncbi:MAG: NADH dehydrogenase, subunit 5, partial [uncultured Acidimicrobiales bacterium]
DAARDVLDRCPGAAGDRRRGDRRRPPRRRRVCPMGGTSGLCCVCCGSRRGGRRGCQRTRRGRGRGERRPRARWPARHPRHRAVGLAHHRRRPGRAILRRPQPAGGSLRAPLLRPGLAAHSGHDVSGLRRHPRPAVRLLDRGRSRVGRTGDPPGHLATGAALGPADPAQPLGGRRRPPGGHPARRRLRRRDRPPLAGGGRQGARRRVDPGARWERVGGGRRAPHRCRRLPVRARPRAPVAAVHDRRPHAGVRPAPRRRGQRRRHAAGASRSGFRGVGRGDTPGLRCGCHHCLLRHDRDARAQRREGEPGVVHGRADGVHDGAGGHRSAPRGVAPHHRARHVQGSAVPRGRRLGHGPSPQPATPCSTCRRPERSAGRRPARACRGTLGRIPGHPPAPVDGGGRARDGVRLGNGSPGRRRLASLSSVPTRPGGRNRGIRCRRRTVRLRRWADRRGDLRGSRASRRGRRAGRLRSPRCDARGDRPCGRRRLAHSGRADGQVAQPGVRVRAHLGARRLLADDPRQLDRGGARARIPPPSAGPGAGPIDTIEM